VPYGLILGRLAGLGDIRKQGSGNIGATNLLRVGGKKLGAITLLLDALKGAVPVLIAKQVHMDYAVLAAFGAFLGHLFPVWLKFRGGKGVATALGVLTALDWAFGLSLMSVWLLVFALSRVSSMAALTAFGFAPFLALLVTGDFQVAITAFVISIIVWIRHHENIRRIAAGEETKMNFGPKT
jgi:glycerol-3-phosphate acyltransferase PlsY